MLMKEVTSFLGADPMTTADTLEELASDLRRLAKGEPPNVAVLSAAPLLHGWGTARKPVSCLTGKVYGHPKLGDGRIALTSEIFAIDRERRWVRTLSRFYALGPSGMFGQQD